MTDEIDVLNVNQPSHVAAARYRATRLGYLRVPHREEGALNEAGSLPHLRYGPAPRGHVAGRRDAVAQVLTHARARQKPTGLAAP